VSEEKDIVTLNNEAFEDLWHFLKENFDDSPSLRSEVVPFVKEKLYIKKRKESIPPGQASSL